MWCVMDQMNRRNLNSQPDLASKDRKEKLQESGRGKSDQPGEDGHPFGPRLDSLTLFAEPWGGRALGKGLKVEWT